MKLSENQITALLFLANRGSQWLGELNSRTARSLSDKGLAEIFHAREPEASGNKIQITEAGRAELTARGLTAKNEAEPEAMFFSSAEAPASPAPAAPASPAAPDLVGFLNSPITPKAEPAPAAEPIPFRLYDGGMVEIPASAEVGTTRGPRPAAEVTIGAVAVVRDSAGQERRAVRMYTPAEWAADSAAMVAELSGSSEPIEATEPAAEAVEARFEAAEAVARAEAEAKAVEAVALDVARDVYGPATASPEAKARLLAIMEGAEAEPAPAEATRSAASGPRSAAEPEAREDTFELPAGAFKGREASPGCCSLPRRKLIRTTRLDTGEEISAAWVIEACNTPLFGEGVDRPGTCGACRRGWTHPENYLATERRPAREFNSYRERAEAEEAEYFERKIATAALPELIEIATFLIRADPQLPISEQRRLAELIEARKVAVLDEARKAMAEIARDSGAVAIFFDDEPAPAGAGSQSIEGEAIGELRAEIDKAVITGEAQGRELLLPDEPAPAAEPAEREDPDGNP